MVAETISDSDDKVARIGDFQIRDRRLRCPLVGLGQTLLNIRIGVARYGVPRQEIAAVVGGNSATDEDLTLRVVHREGQGGRCTQARRCSRSDEFKHVTLEIGAERTRADAADKTASLADTESEHMELVREATSGCSHRHGAADSARSAVRIDRHAVDAVVCQVHGVERVLVCRQVDIADADLVHHGKAVHVTLPIV